MVFFPETIFSCYFFPDQSDLNRCLHIRNFILLLHPVYRMRYLAFILSLYVLVLTAVPCVDVQITSFESAQQSHQDHHQGEGDHCSPFCTCNCCATSVIFQDFQVQLNSFAFIEKQYSFYATGSYHGPVTAIWQPPKIA